MRTELVALGLVAAVSSTTALLSWWRSRQVLRRLEDLTLQRDQAEADKASLIGTLSALNKEENQRICRLEHDVKSSLGVILGFSALLRESVERDTGTSPLALKNISAIHQAATKILQTVDAAVKGMNSEDRQAISTNGKT